MKRLQSAPETRHTWPGPVLRIEKRLAAEPFPPWPDAAPTARVSAVLFLIARHPAGQIGLILNKRSAHVSQPGDLCLTGGHPLPVIDPLLALRLRFPGSPLARWPQWPRHRRHAHTPVLARYLATALREGWEEMGLSPCRLFFLGPLRPARLVLFNRIIFPMVVWLDSWPDFQLNREVEKIVFLPFDDLHEPVHYGRYQLQSAGIFSARTYPCFIHREKDDAGQWQQEILWGATFRIVTGFLRRILDFNPPETPRGPLVKGRLGRSYLKKTAFLT